MVILKIKSQRLLKIKINADYADFTKIKNQKEKIKNTEKKVKNS